MKKIFTRVTAIAAFALAFTSCDLNLFPEDTIVYDPDKTFFEVEADVEGSHNTIYAYFRSTSGGFYNTVCELQLDGFNATREYGNNMGAIHRTDASFTASDNEVESFYAGFYSAITRYNMIVEAADELLPDSPLYAHAQYVKAEALIARAHSYLRLARQFGPAYNEDTADTDLCVPLVTVYDQTARPHRASVAQVYGQIVQDLSDAREIFEKEESKPWLTESAQNAQYFTVDAIRFLNCRTLLDMGNYKDAADSAAAIINSNVYALSENATALRDLNEKSNGTEAIMQLYASTEESAPGYSLYTNYGKESNSPTGYAYKAAFIPSKTLLDSYDNSDIRREVWFERTSSTLSGFHPINYGDKNNYVDVYLFTRYKGDPSLNTSGMYSAVVMPKPYSIAELYLIAAEGYLKAGKKDDSRKYLVKLQSQRGAKPSAATDETIQREWLREMVGEGVRFSCLKRWDAGTSVRTAQDKAIEQALVFRGEYFDARSLEAGDYTFCWPIPTYEIQCNSNLKDEQNPGYGSK